VAEVPVDGSELVEADVVAKRGQRADADKVQHRVGLVDTCWGEAHLMRMAGRPHVCYRAHGVRCRSLDSFLDDPASAA
jgi:hypothetical protein